MELTLSRQDDEPYIQRGPKLPYRFPRSSHESIVAERAAHPPTLPSTVRKYCRDRPLPLGRGSLGSSRHSSHRITRLTHEGFRASGRACTEIRRRTKASDQAIPSLIGHGERERLSAVKPSESALARVSRASLQTSNTLYPVVCVKRIYSVSAQSSPYAPSEN